jgi:hypothetical protein
MGATESDRANAARLLGLNPGERYDTSAITKAWKRRLLVTHPDKWIFRILQETKAEGFPPCRNVVVSNNRFVFQRAKVRDEINIGPDTAPETFQFANNRWLAEDKPEASKPKLPVAETGGTYGK